MLLQDPFHELTLQLESTKVSSIALIIRINCHTNKSKLKLIKINEETEDSFLALTKMKTSKKGYNSFTYSVAKINASGRFESDRLRSRLSNKMWCYLITSESWREPPPVPKTGRPTMPPPPPPRSLHLKTPTGSQDSLPEKPHSNPSQQLSPSCTPGTCSALWEHPFPPWTDLGKSSWSLGDVWHVQGPRPMLRVDAAPSL